MLHRLHEGHLGLNKSLARARLLMYWPQMNADIKALVSQCSTCCHFAYRQPSERLMLRRVPDQPWQRIGVDLFEYGSKHYLVAYCAYSNYPEVEFLPLTTCRIVVDKLSAMFARHGIPIEVCTDGGPQFTSHEFASFRTKCDFIHTISSPRFPQSNGLAEKGVQVVKRLLKKTQHSNEDFWVGLLNYRTTPLEDGRTPSELLMGRQLRGRLPDFTAATTSTVRKHAQTFKTNHHLAPLRPGDVVRIRDDSSWCRKARVERCVAPRSYRVCTEDGQHYRRNRRHLRKTAEPFEPGGTSVEDECRDEQYTRASAAPYEAQHPSPLTPTVREPTTSLLLQPESRTPRVPEEAAATLPSSTGAAPAQLLAQPLSTPAEAGDPTQGLHRTMRQRRAPSRLHYDHNFIQRT